ncbi:MAG: hypothetical protein DRP64_09435 [Verrucomicrobia bacterium]|nr:MAG: hypothetical protein DRP64_09435 [Verrucomicrobiota bacterium]
MTALAEKIYNETLELPVDERLSLIDKLLHGTNLATQSEIDQAWCKEVEERYGQIKSGETPLILGEAIFEKLRGKYMG